MTTTVWETGEGKHQHSLSMKMLASTQRFFYKDLAGISPAGPGYSKITFKPQVVGDLTWARALLRTVRGVADIHWQRHAGGLDMKVQVPCNSRAKIAIPKLGLSSPTIRESGEVVWEGDRYVDGGGRYRFKLSS